MSPNKKTRSDALLQNLSEERQEQIIGWCNTPKKVDEDGTVIHPGGYQFAQEQLAADGIKVSPSSLSAFYSWWNLKHRYLQADATARQQEELMLKFRPGDAETAAAFGKFVFMQQAIAQGDPETFRDMEKLRQADAKGAREDRKIEQTDRKLEQAERTIALHERREAKAKEVLANAGGISPETRQELESALSLM